MQLDERSPHLADDHRLRQIVAENADGILVVDGDGRVRFLNPAAAQILGRPSGDLMDQLFGFPVLRGERAEIDLLHPDGSWQIAEMRVVDTEWDGTAAQLISLRDITEHRRAQQALRDAEAFNWAILNALPIHVAVLDERGTILAVNDAWRDFARTNGDPELRYTGVGQNYFTVCQHATGDEAPLVVTGMRAVLAGEQRVFELEYPCHTVEEERWFVLRVVALQSPPPGLVISHTNVTSQKLMARAAAEADALRERLRAMEHELRQVEEHSGIDKTTPRRPGSAPLRQRSAMAFQEAIRSYIALLNAALRHRTHQGSPTDQALRDLGERLGRDEATPRDVIEIHLASVRALSTDAPHARQQAYLEEGRLLMLELMGHLAAHYRTRALGQPATQETDHVHYRGTEDTEIG